MFKFAWPWIFTLLLLPWLMYWLLPAAQIKRSAALKIPFFNKLATVPSSDSLSKQDRQQHIYLYLMWCLLITALANPQQLGPPLPITQRGHDIFLAIDISGSMEIPDLQWHHHTTDRLSVVKHIAKNFIEQRTGDRIGLILFGSHAYLQTPLTFDRKTVQAQLADATIALAGPKTALGDAIALAVKRLISQPKTMRLLVLLSDGANNSGSLTPQQALMLAKQYHVRIYSIGLGADTLQVSNMFGSSTINPAADLDENMLKRLANETGGLYFRAKDSMTLKQIYHQIDQLEPVSHNNTIFRSIRYLYPWPLGMALLVSVLWLSYYSRCSFMIRTTEHTTS